MPIVNHFTVRVARSCSDFQIVTSKPDDISVTYQNIRAGSSSGSDNSFALREIFFQFFGGLSVVRMPVSTY